MRELTLLLNPRVDHRCSVHLRRIIDSVGGIVTVTQHGFLASALACLPGQLQPTLTSSDCDRLHPILCPHAIAEAARPASDSDSRYSKSPRDGAILEAVGNHAHHFQFLLGGNRLPASILSRGVEAQARPLLCVGLLDQYIRNAC
jgi:hypothetical protein